MSVAYCGGDVFSVFLDFSECRTIAPYKPYLAMTDPSPQVFSVRLHFARRFWNQTYRE